MQNKPKEIVEVEKVLDLIIDDYNFEKDILECINISNYKLTKDKIGKVKKHFKNLKRLFISKTEIEDLTFIDDLVLLEELTITNCNLKVILLKKANNNLKIIDLSCNQIENIEFLKNYKNVKLIDFSENEINDILVLKNFNSLIKLNLSKNKIVDISSLKGIKIKGDDLLYEEGELLLGENAIFDLTPLYDSLKSNQIQFMNAYDNPLIYPPNHVVGRDNKAIYDWFDKIIKNANYEIKRAKQNNSKILDLGKLGLTDLSLIPNLFELVDLEELILSNHYAEYKYDKWHPIESKKIHLPNNIYSISPEIKKLVNLKKLILGGDWNLNKEKSWNRWRIHDISEVFLLKYLEVLNVSNNLIEDIKITKKHPKLKIIHINNNKIKTISGLYNLVNLEELYISNNEFARVDSFKRLSNIKALDIHGNKIKNLNPLIDIIEKIGIADDKWLVNTLCVNNNPLKNPGIEVVERGKEAVLATLKENSETTTFDNDEIKFILVGNSEAGKTTLAKYLKGDKDYMIKHPYTLWMDVLELFKNNTKVRLLDFGGHDYYHDTHHIFFSTNTVYLLLYNKESNKFQQRTIPQENEAGEKEENTIQDYPIEYWLDAIRFFTKKKETTNFAFEIESDNDENSYLSKVLLVQNKVNTSADVEDLNNLSLKKDYPFIFNFTTVDLHNQKNIETTNDLIAEVIGNSNITGATYPIYYKKVKEAIIIYSAKPILKFEEFKIFCEKVTNLKLNEKYVINIANYLENIGLIVYNNDTIFLVKRNLSKNISNLFWKLHKEDGMFTESYAKDKIKDYTKEILDLLLEYKIIFKLPENEKESKYVAPLYLPEKPNKLINILINKNEKPVRRFKYKGFIHKNIILHIFSEYSNQILIEELNANTYFWKNGLVIRENDELILIRFHNETIENGGSYIELISLNKSINEDFISRISKKIIAINKGYKIEEMVTHDGVDFVPLDFVLKNEETNNFTFLYNEKYYKLNDFKKYLKKPNTMKKIFISYSKDDLELVNQFQDHLSSLKRDGLIGTWYCTELLAGGEWDKDIQRHFDESDIICFMISSNLMRTDYIHKYEITNAFKKKEIQKDFKIVPIVLSFCSWSTKENNLSNFTALPYAAKPVSDFRDKNMAWYIIVECIRYMIEKNVQSKNDDFFDGEFLPTNIRKIYERIVRGDVDNNI